VEGAVAAFKHRLADGVPATANGRESRFWVSLDRRRQLENRVARFSWVQNTKAGKNIPNEP
jgi:hypothetical protein